MDSVVDAAAASTSPADERSVSTHATAASPTMTMNAMEMLIAVLLNLIANLAATLNTAGHTLACERHSCPAFDAQHCNHALVRGE